MPQRPVAANEKCVRRADFSDAEHREVIVSVNAWTRYRVRIREGNVGKIRDVYFDDEEWSIRYLIVGRLTGRRMLISPFLLTPTVDVKAGSLQLDLSATEMQDLPDTGSIKPVSRLMEGSYAPYHDYAIYGGRGVGASRGPLTTLRPEVRERVERERREREAEGRSMDLHLHSAKEVEGYAVSAQDGFVGYLADLLFDSESWSMRYLIVRIENGWTSRLVPIASNSLYELNWLDRRMSIALTRKQIG